MTSINSRNLQLFQTAEIFVQRTLSIAKERPPSGLSELRAAVSRLRQGGDSISVISSLDGARPAKKNRIRPRKLGVQRRRSGLALHEEYRNSPTRGVGQRRSRKWDQCDGRQRAAADKSRVIFPS